MNDARAAGAPDFVDRLVVKAFGGAEVAAARVPSAYEPLRPHAGLMPGTARSERIDEDGMSGEDAMDGDAHESPDRRRRARSARTPAADGARALDANAAEEGERAVTARRRRTRAAARGDATDRRNAASSSGRAMDGDDPAGALMATPSLLNPQGSQFGDRHADDDASAPLARLASDAAAPHSTRSGGQDANAPAAEGAAHVVQPSARLRASLDMSPFMREPGGEDGADAGSQHDASEALTRDGMLMPVAHGVSPHASDDRGGWREPASRRWNDEASATPSDVTVNVTIGRVDVRAVQAAAPAERPARTRGAQPIALDEYLARHGGAR